MRQAEELEAWAAAVADVLGLGPEVLGATGALLDVAHDASHTVARPAAPVTTFLIGWAAGAGVMSLEQAVAQVEALAARWTEEMPG